jgi:RHS repeat-associated protein
VQEIFHAPFKIEPTRRLQVAFLSSFVSFFSKLTAFITSSFRIKNLRRKLVCLALVLSLLILPLPSKAFSELSSLSSSAVNIYSLPVQAIVSLSKRLFKSRANQMQVDTLLNRQAQVTKLRVTPFKLVGYRGQVVNFSALPLDTLDRVVQGVRLNWTTTDTSKMQIDDSGRAVLLQPGLVRIICRVGIVRGEAVILIRPGNRPEQSDAEWRADQAALSRLSAIITNTGTSGMINLLPSLLDQLIPSAEAQSTGGYYGNDSPFDEVWSEPRNLVGTPRNRILEPTRLGPVLPEGSNFSMSIPMANVGGRGLGVNMALNYNSRVWSRHGSAVAFDAPHTWPSPGFHLGFGRIIAYGSSSATKYILIDPNGTRRYLGTGGTRSQNVTLTTQDGTHITYVGDGSYGGTIYYPDGTRAVVTLDNNRLVVSQVTDTNGNYITITYLSVTCEQNCQENCVCPIYWPPLAIDHITDSLGRIVQFNYDSNLNLTSITAPGLGGTVQNPVTQTVVQFDYESRTISNNFSGLTVENRPTGNVNFIQHVYFPATHTGVKFSYTAFGNAYNVSIRRQMSISSGVISDGTENASVAFNYQQSSAPALTDAPAFSQRTESPGGTFSYSTSDDSTAQTRTVTITMPDTTAQQTTASQLFLTRSTNSSLLENGLLTKAELKRGTTSYAKSVYTYANDPGGFPQVQSILGYNDSGTQTKQDFDYDAYGNVTNKREYGYQQSGSWVVRRRTHLTYKTDTSYLNEYLRSLVTQIEVMDGNNNTSDLDDVAVAKSMKIYDNYSAMTGMEDYGGTAAPPGHLSSYDTTKTVRGNVTGATEWSDIAGNIATTRNNKRDIFGNVIKAQVSCCNEKGFTYSESTYWSVPESQTDGPSSGIHLTSSATYDFNTGVTNTTTDPNNQTTSYSYDAALRNTATTIPTGAVGGMNYYDNTLTSSDYKDYWEDGVHKLITASSKRDGWGRTIESVNPHHGQVNTGYDAMGRVLSVTSPFTEGSTPSSYTTSYQYDSLGRATVVTLPDGNTIQYNYSGATVTTTDQVNRKIRRERDGLGRLVKVAEQDSSGNLTQETTYTYNVLDKLTQVNQGGQIRAWKYDALGRVLYERHPEKAASIWDGGAGMWSMKYTYTDFDAVETRMDARGAVTTYSYDTLNRLTGVSYTVPSGVASTPTVTYTYDTNQSSSTNGQLLNVSVGSNYSESYSYDSQVRVASVAYTIDSKTYTTNYGYNVVNQKNQIGHMALTFDGMGHIYSVNNFLTAATYDLNGLIASDSLVIISGYVNESFGYDAQRSMMTSHTATKGSTSLMDLTYNYTASAGQMGANSTAGNADQVMGITGSINGTTESQSFTYDLLGRVATSNQTTNGVSAQRRFVYDRFGNRTSVYNATSGGTQIQSVAIATTSSVANNRISSVTTNGGSAVSYTYDANGNLTNDGAHSYSYDAENRVVNLDSGSTASYGYDHQNRRIKKVAGGATRHYVWEGAQVLAEYNGLTGGVLIQYYYAHTRLIAKAEGSTIYFFLTDKLSARVMLDINGNVVGRQAHLPFGEELGTSGSQEKHHFTSYESDTESGNDYAMNRGYGQNVGRFNQADPFESSADESVPQSWNRYLYTLNDPNNFIDPDGLNRFSPNETDPCGVFSGGFNGGGGEAAPSSSCQIQVGTSGTPHISFPPGQHVPSDHLNKLGEWENGVIDGYWGFFFEVRVILPGGTNANDYTFNQYVIATEHFKIRINDVLVEVPALVRYDPTDKNIAYDPNLSGAIGGNYYWIDAPDRIKYGEIQIGEPGKEKFYKEPIEEGFAVWTFIFTATHKRQPSRSCQKVFQLSLNVKDRKASWNATSY